MDADRSMTPYEAFIYAEKMRRENIMLQRIYRFLKLNYLEFQSSFTIEEAEELLIEYENNRR
jgi:hypothetical protein